MTNQSFQERLQDSRPRFLDEVFVYFSTAFLGSSTEGDLCCLKTWFIVCNRRIDEAWSRQIKGFEVDKRISSDTRINFDDVWTLNTRCRCFYSLMWYFSTSIGGILTLPPDQVLNNIVIKSSYALETKTCWHFANYNQGGRMTRREVSPQE